MHIYQPFITHICANEKAIHKAAVQRDNGAGRCRRSLSSPVMEGSDVFRNF